MRPFRCTVLAGLKSRTTCFYVTPLKIAARVSLPRRRESSSVNPGFPFAPAIKCVYPRLEELFFKTLLLIYEFFTLYHDICNKVNHLQPLYRLWHYYVFILLQINFRISAYIIKQGMIMIDILSHVPCPGRYAGAICRPRIFATEQP